MMVEVQMAEKAFMIKSKGFFETRRLRSWLLGWQIGEGTRVGFRLIWC